MTEPAFTKHDGKPSGQNLGFHAHSGLYFKRLDSGAVRVMLGYSTAQPHWPKEEWVSIVLDAGTWASVVASVSAKSETSGSFQAAEDLHAGKFDSQTRRLGSDDGVKA